MSSKPTYEELEKRVKELENEAIKRRRHSDELMNESEASLNALMNATIETAVFVDLEGRILAINEITAKGFGKSVDELIGAVLFDNFPADLALSRKAKHEEVILSGKPLRFTDERAGRIYDNTVYPVFDDKGDIRALAIYAGDITERNRAYEELRESEEQFRGVVENIPGTVYRCLNDTHWTMLFVSEEIENLTGYPASHFLKNEIRTYTSIIHPDDRQVVYEKVQKAISKGMPFTLEYRIIDAEGDVHWVYERGLGVGGKDNEVEYLDGVIIDITERIRVEKELQKLASVVRHSTDLVNLATLEGKMIFLNEAGCEMLGIDPKNVEQTHILEVIPDHLHDLVQRELLPTLMENQTWKGDLQYRNLKTNKLTDVHAVTFTIQDPNTSKPLYLANVSQDITERKRAEEEKEKLEKQLQQVQKREAIGTLAGGIAHDFNNILASIFGYTDLAKIKLEQGENIERYLDEVLNAAFRARDLVKHILAFSRQTEIERSPIVIHPLIKESLTFLKASLPSTIEIRSDLSASDSTIIADPTQVHQIILNLCTNAAYAMKEKGGVLELRLEEMKIEDERTVQYKDLKEGKYIRLIVSDTGYGIPEEMIDKIYDPFFTTKERGEGTGMGLSVVHGILEDMRGAVSVYSEIGKGTTFEVLIPIYEGEVSDFGIAQDSLKEGKGTILFVDDEESILDSGGGILKRLGYEVFTTTSPIKALEIFTAGPDDFDLVLTDMTMPQMTGIELSENLIKIRSDIPIILCSGFSAAVTPEKLRDVGISETVMKPMIASEIASVIDHVINPEDK